MKPGDLLNCEDGHAVVVEPGTTAVDGLLTLLEEEYGERFTATNPAIIEALPSVRLRTWFSCSKAWREEHCDAYAENWWSEDGDGKRFITVAFYDGSIYRLGDNALDAAGASPTTDEPEHEAVPGGSGTVCTVCGRWESNGIHT